MDTKKRRHLPNHGPIPGGGRSSADPRPGSGKYAKRKEEEAFARQQARLDELEEEFRQITLEMERSKKPKTEAKKKPKPAPEKKKEAPKRMRKGVSINRRKARK